MRVDVNGKQATLDLAGAADLARTYEAAGFDGLWTSEAAHDPFLPLLLASTATERMTLGTAIAVAFARSPMTVAHTAWDLQAHSHGRFVLGLGTQVRAHVVRRFSMPWSHPAARMHEYVRALRAIWAAWDGEAPLDFRGEFYEHTLMPPNFSPGKSPHGTPRIFLAGVNARMIETAGAVADGFVLHSFTTTSYTAEVVKPALKRGFRDRSGDSAGFEISLPLLVVTGRTAQERAASEAATRAQIAFYASTPAYRGVMDHHGWADVHDELHSMSRRGEWQEMAARIDDDMLDAFAVCAEPDRVLPVARERYDGLIDRVSFSLAHDPGDGLDLQLAAGARSVS